jgi:hypothetical protein
LLLADSLPPPPYPATSSFRYTEQCKTTETNLGLTCLTALDRVPKTYSDRAVGTLLSLQVSGSYCTHASHLKVDVSDF